MAREGAGGLFDQSDSAISTRMAITLKENNVRLLGHHPRRTRQSGLLPVRRRAVVEIGLSLVRHTAPPIHWLRLVRSGKCADQKAPKSHMRAKG